MPLEHVYFPYCNILHAFRDYYNNFHVMAINSHLNQLTFQRLHSLVFRNVLVINLNFDCAEKPIISHISFFLSFFLSGIWSFCYLAEHFTGTEALNCIKTNFVILRPSLVTCLQLHSHSIFLSL